MKTILYYYSRTGNNRYLAERIANEINCDIERIRPRADVFFFYIIKFCFGIKKLNKIPKDYDRVILVGPIWMGQFVCPLKSFVKKYLNEIKLFHFLTCCGSGYEVKDEKFGHALVFKEIETLLGEKCKSCTALPIGLVVPEEHKEDSKIVMATRLSDSNFNPDIKTNFDNFIKGLN